MRKIDCEQDGLKKLDGNVYENKAKRLGSEGGRRMSPDRVKGVRHEQKDREKKHRRHNKKFSGL